MLTPRMPLYIPCVYVVFMYTSAVAAWRLGNNRYVLCQYINLVFFLCTITRKIILLINYFYFDLSNGVNVWGLGPAATAALAGLMGEMIYSPYDITGNNLYVLLRNNILIISVFYYDNYNDIIFLRCQILMVDMARYRCSGSRPSVWGSSWKFVLGVYIFR